MEHVSLDGPKGGRQCEYDGINVNDVDVVMVEMPWFVSGSGVVRKTLP
jgi:hypothetical protein